MTKTLQSLIIVAFLTACSNNLHPDTDKKFREIENFKSELISLADSANYYFDQIETELENGKSVADIPAETIGIIKSIEKQIDTKSRTFAKTAEEIKLTKEEYEKIYSDLETLMTPYVDKFKMLSEKGLLIE